MQLINDFMNRVDMAHTFTAIPLILIRHLTLESLIYFGGQVLYYTMLGFLALLEFEINCLSNKLINC